MRQKGVPIRQICISVDRYGGNVKFATQRASVQRLDVLQLVHVADAVGVDLSVGERVEHERVVGVRAMREVDGRFLSGSHDFVPRLLRAWRSALEMSS